jgi:hypothetical protein
VNESWDAEDRKWVVARVKIRTGSDEVKPIKKEHLCRTRRDHGNELKVKRCVSWSHKRNK